MSPLGLGVSTMWRAPVGVKSPVWASPRSVETSFAPSKTPCGHRERDNVRRGIGCLLYRRTVANTCQIAGTPRTGRRGRAGTTVRVCDLPSQSGWRSYWRCPESCPVVVPSGACLVASSPDAPGASEGLAYGRREHPARFGHGHADQAHVLGRLLAGTDGQLAGVVPVFPLVSGGEGCLWPGGCARAGSGPGRQCPGWAWRSRRRARGHTWTARCGGRRSATGGAGRT